MSTQEMGQSNALVKILCSDVAEDHQIVSVGKDILVWKNTTQNKDNLQLFTFKCHKQNSGPAH